MPRPALKLVSSNQMSFAETWPLLYKVKAQRTARPRSTIKRLAASAVIVSQFDFILTVRPPGEITPTMRNLENMLIKISSNSGELPNNPILGERAGGLARCTVGRSLKRMQAMGIIRIETEAGRRRIWMAATNLFTGWGEARIGHAPYSSNPRGSAPQAPTRAPNSPPLPPACGWSPGPSTKAARQCQWPMWGDNQKPTFIYCDAPSAFGKSYCPHHLAGNAFQAVAA